MIVAYVYLGLVNVTQTSYEMYLSLMLFILQNCCCNVMQSINLFRIPDQRVVTELIVVHVDEFWSNSHET